MSREILVPEDAERDVPVTSSPTAEPAAEPDLRVRPKSSFPVVGIGEVEDGMAVEPNCACIIPPELRRQAEERLKGQRTEDRGQRSEARVGNLPPRPRFSRIKQLLKQEQCMDLSMYADSFLEKSLEQRMQATACASPDDYYAHLEQNPAEGKVLQASLQIHFSQFFRNPLTFAVLERVILPELIQKKKHDQHREIRIWSAGCAAGQEACSLAILLEESLGNSHPGLTYRIFATDLDESQLEQAREGYYPAAALDNLTLKRTRTWFTRQDQGYRVRAGLHKNLDFSTFDLIQQEGGSPPASIFGDFDLILCCNLLIYYRPKTQNAILDRFEGCLARGGILVTGEAEHGLAMARHYREVCPPAPIFRLNRTARKNP